MSKNEIEADITQEDWQAIYEMVKAEYAREERDSGIPEEVRNQALRIMTFLTKKTYPRTFATRLLPTWSRR